MLKLPNFECFAYSRLDSCQAAIAVKNQPCGIVVYSGEAIPGEEFSFSCSLQKTWMWEEYVFSAIYIGITVHFAQCHIFRQNYPQPELLQIIGTCTKAINELELVLLNQDNRDLQACHMTR